MDPRTLVSELSVARQLMVEIAKALSHDSRVLIMDEPSATLSDAEVDELFRVIGGLRAQGLGIVYISHKMDELQRIADASRCIAARSSASPALWVPAERRSRGPLPER